MDLNWKGIFIAVVIVLAVIAGISYLPQYFMEYEADKIIDDLTLDLLPGVVVNGLGYDAIKLSPFGKVYISGFKCKITVDDSYIPLLKGEYICEADRIEINEKNEYGLNYEIYADGLRVTSILIGDKVGFLSRGEDLLEKCDARLMIRVEPESRASMMLKNIFKRKIKKILYGKKDIVSFEIDGLASVSVDKKPVYVDFEAGKKDGKYYLDIDRKSFADISIELIRSAINNAFPYVEINDAGLYNVQNDILGEKTLRFEDIYLNVNIKESRGLLDAGKYRFRIENMDISLDGYPKGELNINGDGISITRSDKPDHSTGLLSLSRNIFKEGSFHLKIPIECSKALDIYYELKKVREILMNYSDTGAMPWPFNVSGIVGVISGDEHVDVKVSAEQKKGKILLDFDSSSINELTEKMVRFVVEQGVGGVDVEDFKVGRFEKNMDSSFMWDGLSIRIKPYGNEDAFMFKGFEINAGTVAVLLMDPDKDEFMLRVEDISAEFRNKWHLPDSGEGKGMYKVYNGELELFFNLDTGDIPNIFYVLKDLVSGFMDFIQESHTHIPVNFSATVGFTMGGKDFTSRVWTIPKGGEYFLTMDRKVIKAIAQEMDIKGGITEAEIEVIAMNPLRAPKLLWIWECSVMGAKMAYQKDLTIPEDVYRHVIWSYLLTKYYGPEFSEYISTVHEYGDDNTVEEHKKDLKNNEVGRGYAMKGYPFNRIFELMRKDPRVAKQ